MEKEKQALLNANIAIEPEILPVAETPAPVVEEPAPLPEKKTTKAKKEEVKEEVVILETVSDEDREDSN
jgi:hypothetical protein